MATELIQEYVDGRGVTMKVEADGVIRGVKILGLTSSNGRDYPKKTLEKAVELYEDSRVNVDHQQGNPGSPRRYKDRMGIIRHVELREDGLFADYYYNPQHSLAKQLEWDAKNSPHSVGFSHNIQAKTRLKGGRMIVEEITRVQSVDLVADPATTRGLFEQNEPTPGHDKKEGSAMPEPITMEVLEADHADLVEAIGAKAIAGRDDATVIEKLKADNAKLTSEATTLAEQVEAVGKEKVTLEEKIDAFEAVEKLAKQKTEVNAVIESAKLPEAMVSDVFRESLLNASEAGRKALLEDRQALAKQVDGSKPRSKEQGKSDAASVTDTKSFMSAIT